MILLVFLTCRIGFEQYNRAAMGPNLALGKDVGDGVDGLGIKKSFLQLKDPMCGHPINLMYGFNCFSQETRSISTVEHALNFRTFCSAESQSKR
jgi:hypothetical protein